MSEAPRLPAVLVLTDRAQATAAGHALHEVVAELGGLDLAVVFREKDLADAERGDLAHLVATVASIAGVPFLVSSTRPTGVSARGTQLADGEQVPVVRPRWLGRSCHAGSFVAGRAGMDYVTLSPVFATPSKPGYGPALGVEGLGRLVAGAATPVYALGGVGPGRARACIEAGAWGVAAMGAVMTASRPRAAAGLLVDEVHAARPEGRG